MPINVISNIEPYGGNSWYLIDDKFIRGGFRCVDTIADRTAIHPQSLKAGMLVYTNDTKKMWQLQDDLVTWFEFKTTPDPTPSPFRLGLHIADDLIAGGADYVFVETVIFSVNFAGSKAISKTAPSVETSVIIRKNGTAVGFAIFKSDGTVVFQAPAQVIYDSGDLLTLEFPTGNDLSGVTITLSGLIPIETP